MEAVRCPNCQALNNQDGNPNLHVFNCVSCNHLVIFDDKKGIVSTNNWFVKTSYKFLKWMINQCSACVMIVVEIPRNS